MARSKRNLGQEIIRELRELKRGEYSRVINLPYSVFNREKKNISQEQRVPTEQAG